MDFRGHFSLSLNSTRPLSLVRVLMGFVSSIICLLFSGFLEGFSSSSFVNFSNSLMLVFENFVLFVRCMGCRKMGGCGFLDF